MKLGTLSVASFAHRASDSETPLRPWLIQARTGSKNFAFASTSHTRNSRRIAALEQQSTDAALLFSSRSSPVQSRFQVRTLRLIPRILQLCPFSSTFPTFHRMSFASKPPAPPPYPRTCMDCESTPPSSTPVSRTQKEPKETLFSLMSL